MRFAPLLSLLFIAPCLSVASASSPDELSLRIVLEQRAFAPDEGENLRFALVSASVGSEAFVTCRVFSLAGRLVRVLYRDEPRAFGSTDPRDEWDGRNRDGRVVEGGVYIVHITWGAAAGRRDGNDKAAVAVVR